MSLIAHMVALTKPSIAPWHPHRIVALDVARFLALVGMFTAHFLMGQGPAQVQVLVTGFPSTAFAVLGGVSVAVSTRRLMDDGRPLTAGATVAVRGLVIAAIGLALGAVPLVIVMVLAYYGFALVAVACVLWLPGWVHGCLAAALVLIGPQLILWARQTGETGGVPAPSFSSPVHFLQTLLFTGFYPVITWFTFMLIGLCAGRAMLSAKSPSRVATRVLVPGILMAVAGITSDLVSRPAVIDALRAGGSTQKQAQSLVTGEGFGTPLGDGWIAVFSAAPHTGTTADILRTSGVALVMLALLLLAIPRDASRLPLPLLIIARAGSAPLTLYIGHFFGFYAVFLLAMIVGPVAESLHLMGVGGIALHVLGAVAVGAYLYLTDRRGPLEALVSRTVRSVTKRFPPVNGGPGAPRRRRPVCGPGETVQQNE
ncbi:DUF1624 domain-containing protein [Plantibacter sp. VKM Ac-2885]|uniref:heparan-alpha-glucosaminide N-acetyltransferase domain-containing protein n=1 Tax=Plantibacter sp. VKM Ac-2885 TaxID=2783828 RepID=UPI00188A6858|nr:heparan-alpha-glucosaminide N-acetyltransferase domain-containing protein [Plantibacter sp. VKM Ac-2885]MBF4514085.1 DUF1624 domain-containing protein [Plantibacter sp. VKM Ac-2885]